MADPQSLATEADLVAQYEFALRVRDRTNDANGAVVRIRDIKRQIDERIKESNNDRDIARAGEELKKKLSAVEEEIYQVRNQSGQDPLNYPIKLNNRIAALLGVVLSGNARPTDQSYEVFAELSQLLQVQLDRLADIERNDLARFNQLLERKGRKPVVPSAQPVAGVPPRELEEMADGMNDALAYGALKKRASAQAVCD